jgi:hypothetical protein
VNYVLGKNIYYWKTEIVDRHIIQTVKIAAEEIGVTLRLPMGYLSKIEITEGFLVENVQCIKCMFLICA